MSRILIFLKPTEKPGYKKQSMGFGNKPLFESSPCHLSPIWHRVLIYTNIIGLISWKTGLIL